MAAVRGVPLAPEARYRAFAHPEIFSEDVRGPPDAGAPPADVSAFPEHMHAYAANCKRTLHYAVHGTLLAKRDRLLHDLGRLRAKALEMASVKAAAAREVASVANEATQRLDAAESLRQTRVRREADELSRQVEEINALAAEVDEAVNGDDGDDRDSLSAEFIGRYRAMYDKCDRLARRPPPAPADADPAAFEKEVKALTNAAAERDALKRILEAKDAMIWRLVEDRRALTEELRALKAGGGGEEKASPRERLRTKESGNVFSNVFSQNFRVRAPSSAPPSERRLITHTDPPRSARSAVGESHVEVSGREGSHADDPAPEEEEEEEEEERNSDEDEDEASASEP